MLFETERAEMAAGMDRAIVNSLRKGNSVTLAVAMIETAIDAIAKELESIDAPVRVSLETDGEKKIVSLVIFDARSRRTVTFDFVPSSCLVRLRGQPIFLAHKEGSRLLLDKVLFEVEQFGGKFR